VILCRSDVPVSDEICEKIALFCNIDERAVIPMTTAETIYEVPLMLEERGLGRYLVEALRLEAKAHEPDLAEWRELVARIKCEKPVVDVGLVGKYVALHDAYLSVAESLRHAGWAHGVDVRITWINSEDLETRGANFAEMLKGVDGIIVPGGFGSRGIEGKIKAANYARHEQIPYLGLCLGLQVAVIGFAREVLGVSDANSTEFNPNTANPVIDLMPNQRQVSDKGGTMRLGNWVCCLTNGSKTQQAYGEPIIFERHRHRYEFNNTYRRRLEEAGMIVSGRSADNSLVEIIELADHPWFVATQFHPEFRSRPTRPHPLFYAFVGACLKHAQAAGLAASERVAEQHADGRSDGYGAAPAQQGRAEIMQSLEGEQALTAGD
jgi:CTP synthase